MLRWGLLGTSFISGTMAEAIRLSPGSTLAAVAGRDPVRLKAFAETHGISRSFQDYNALCSDPDIDVVYVGLPNNLHHTYSLLATSHGKHVLSEKSLTVTMDQTQLLLEGVAERPVFFAEGLMYRAHPVIARFADIIASGRLGDLRVISACYHADIAQFVNPQGGGTLFNLGCYPVSLLQLLMRIQFGSQAFENREIQAFGMRSGLDGNICDAIASIRFGNGVLAQISTSDTHGMSYGFSVSGQKATLRFATNPWLPVAGDNVMEIIDHASGDVTERIVVNSGRDAFLHQVEMVEAAIADGRREAPFPSPDRADSRAIMNFLNSWLVACNQHKS